MTARERAEAAFAEAVQACALDRRVAATLADLAPRLDGARRRLGIAIGKAALAMARGASVDRGVAVVPAGSVAAGSAAGSGAAAAIGPVGSVAAGQGAPPGWRVLEGSHPAPDERSEAAGRAVRELVASAAPDDVVIALVSGGASALVEAPRVPLAELRALVGALMAAGAPIGELNTVRGALSELKAGRLALACAAPIVTLVASDVIGDPLDVIGSGPTIGPWLAAPGAPVEVGLAEDARRRGAIAILERCGLAVPAALAAPIAPRRVARADRAVLVAPMAAFADAVREALAAAGVRARRLDPPLEGDVVDAARRLAAEAPPFVAWGEPTLRVPADHGEGGRAQELALALARLHRGTSRAVLVAGTDGVDGPPPAGRPAPAGAFVDGGTWDAIAAAGIDPAAALARCDAGPALAAAGALFVPGPTGVNHADVAIAL
jgi:glycerate 2-kinase